MSTTYERLPSEDIVAQAQQVRFSQVAGRGLQVLLVLLAGVCYGIGWVPGRLWVGAVCAGLLIRQGWRESTGWQPPAQEPAASR